MATFIYVSFLFFFFSLRFTLLENKRQLPNSHKSEQYSTFVNLGLVTLGQKYEFVMHDLFRDGIITGFTFHRKSP